jgi:hypothetical protein
VYQAILGHPTQSPISQVYFYRFRELPQDRQDLLEEEQDPRDQELLVEQDRQELQEVEQDRQELQGGAQELLEQRVPQASRVQQARHPLQVPQVLLEAELVLQDPRDPQEQQDLQGLDLFGVVLGNHPLVQLFSIVSMISYLMREAPISVLHQQTIYPLLLLIRLVGLFLPRDIQARQE